MGMSTEHLTQKVKTNVGKLKRNDSMKSAQKQKRGVTQIKQIGMKELPRHKRCVHQQGCIKSKKGTLIIEKEKKIFQRWSGYVKTISQ